MTDPTNLGAAAAGDVAARPQFIAVRATVNLDGLHAGEEAIVDVRSPYMQALLAAQYLVPLPADRQPKGDVR